MKQQEKIIRLLQRLNRLGVREVCVAAGARNASLVAALASSKGIRLWHFFEERCAGFFALGRVLVDGRPVAVVTTSGTAAAELLPSVIEAYYQGRPLIVVTADRPARYRHSGAPQAIEQEGLFGLYAEVLAEDASWAARMPLHINVPLDEPLGPVTGIAFGGA